MEVLEWGAPREGTEPPSTSPSPLPRPPIPSLGLLLTHILDNKREWGTVLRSVSRSTKLLKLKGGGWRTPDFVTKLDRRGGGGQFLQWAPEEGLNP